MVVFGHQTKGSRGLYIRGRVYYPFLCPKCRTHKVGFFSLFGFFLHLYFFLGLLDFSVLSKEVHSNCIIFVHFGAILRAEKGLFIGKKQIFYDKISQVHFCIHLFPVVFFLRVLCVTILNAWNSFSGMPC